jgi:NTE family protein
MFQNKKIGLALSGGGFRAAAFHLGTLKKLKELGILSNIDVISTISGGSIIGAFYALKKENFNVFVKSFEEILKINLVIHAGFTVRFLSRTILLLSSIGIVAFLTYSWSWTLIYFLILFILTFAFFYKIFPTSRLIKTLYDSLIFKKKLLMDLPEYPQIVINATNLDTGTMFSFTRTKSFDSSYKYLYNINPEFDTHDFTIAKAVACSSAFPYAFSPTILKFNVGDKIVKPKLIDAGVYDNQGIYRLATGHSQFKSDIVIVSDASSPFKKNFYGINPIPVLGRIMNIMMNRIKNIQFLTGIYETTEDVIFEIGYFCLDWEYEKCLEGFYTAVMQNKMRPHLLNIHEITVEMKNNKEKLIQHLKKDISFNNIVKKGLTKNEIDFISKISTNLCSLSQKEIDLLSRHAETLTEIQIRLYCPTLIIK